MQRVTKKSCNFRNGRFWLEKSERDYLPVEKQENLEPTKKSSGAPDHRMLAYRPQGNKEKPVVLILLSSISEQARKKGDELQAKLKFGIRLLAPEKGAGPLPYLNLCLADSQIKEQVFFCVWDLEQINLPALAGVIEKHLETPNKVSFVVPFEGRHWPGYRPFLLGAWRKTLVMAGGLSPWLRHPRNKLLELGERLAFHGVNRFPYENVFPKNLLPDIHPLPNENELLQKDAKIFSSISRHQNHVIQKKPDFILVGVQKAGTTSVISWLSKHPDIHAPKVQGNGFETNEMHFFGSKKYERLGGNWYQSLFFHPTKKISGEKTPEYLSDPQAIERMHDLCPDTKILISLRNPVERLWSALRHMRRPGVSWGNDSFKEGSHRDAHDLIVKDHLDDDVVTRGHYFDQISHLFKYYPREQVKIVIHERTIKDPAKSRQDLFSFLGLPDLQDEPFPKKNSGKEGVEERSPESLKAIYEYYKPRNEALFELLGDRIEEWDPPEDIGQL